jgi:AcrR family transcriptional regulator
MSTRTLCPAGSRKPGLRPEATVADIAARAGVEPDVFDRYFESKEHYLLAASETAAEQGFSAVAEAFVATPRRSSESARRRWPGR